MTIASPFNKSAIQTALSQAAVNADPGLTLFKNTTIGGRPLGDINNSGTVTSFDTLQYQKWSDGSLTDTDYLNWINNTMNPYMLSNSSTYASYINTANSTISMATVYYEFPGTVDFTPSTSPALSYYYRGGSNVPNIPTNNNIPTSGQISLSNFYGGVGYYNYYDEFLNEYAYNYNLTTNLIVNGWNSVQPVYAKITLNGTSFIESFDQQPALKIGSLPLGSVVYITVGSNSYIAGGLNGGVALQIEHSNTILVNNGGIYGGAGVGGNGQGYNNIGSNGTAGGHGLIINLPALIGTGPSITNNGTIAGGGGGGGGGGQICVATICAGTPTFCAPGGGGGGGRFYNSFAGFLLTAGSPGSGAGSYCAPMGGYSNAVQGVNGSRASAGAGGAGGTNSGATGYAGGAGGNYGDAGTGTSGQQYGGGAGGYAKYTQSGGSTTVTQGTTYGTWA
jgi:hypothetical protein